VRKGFTLVEILVSIAIVSLLVGILLPSVTRAKEIGRRSACLSNLHQIGLASASYLNANRFPPFFDDALTLRGKNFSYSWSDFLVKGRHIATEVHPESIPNRDGTGGVGGVYLAGLASQRATVFQCPQQPDRLWSQVNGIPVSYRADYVITGHTDDLKNGVKGKLPVTGIYLSSKHFQDPALIWMGEAFTPHGGLATDEYVRETQLHRDPIEANPLRHDHGGNYLFGDGHGAWSSTWQTADYLKLGLPWEAQKW
jgi:prepilin-type N-terminal cleavage/methylation domain-containing protein/prepilin-type processing-associated H-X9-DG protein